MGSNAEGVIKKELDALKLRCNITRFVKEVGQSQKGAF